MVTGGFERVASLNLANNRIEHAGALRNPALSYLDLQGNRLTRIPNLGDLKLSSINLRGNPIEYFAYLTLEAEDQKDLYRRLKK